MVAVFLAFSPFDFEMSKIAKKAKVNSEVAGAGELLVQKVSRNYELGTVAEQERGT